MKKLIFLGFLLCLVLNVQAEDQEKKVKSTIKEVTIFKTGAQVFRHGKTQVPAGNSLLTFTGISPSIDRNSIQVKADGDFTLMSVTHQTNYFSPPVEDAEIEVLVAKQKELTDQYYVEAALLEVLKEEEMLITSNRQIGGQQNGVDIEQLRATSEFYRTRLREIKLEKLTLDKKMKKIQKELVDYKAQIGELNKVEGTYTSEIVLAINSQKATSGEFTINYLVKNAGWVPHYDLRVKDVKSPVQLAYKANVFQTSGEDWSKVKLTLSTGDPSQSGVKPTLNPWRLGFYNPPYAYQKKGRRNKAGTYSGISNGEVRQVRGFVMDAETGERLIGATVMVAGTTTGVVTDFDGQYALEVPAYAQSLIISYIGYAQIETAITSNQMNIVLDGSSMELNEVIVTAEKTRARKKRRKREQKDKAKKMKPTIPVPVQTIENTTTVSFKIELPYSIPSNGKQYVVEMKTHELPAYYEYYCVPKLDRDAFLTAQVSDWEDINLLNGEANIFFEGTYVGKSLLNVQSTEDTLQISLGRDKNIVVSRTKQKEYSKKRFLSNKKIETRAWEIEIRNKKKQAINLVIEDQFPISTTEEIKVKKEVPKGTKLEEDTGLLTWKFSLDPSKTKTLDFRYTVEYAKKKQVQLE